MTQKQSPEKSGTLHNWSGNYRFRATRLYRPQTVQEVKEVVSRSRKLKVIGSRHSFNDIADSTQDHVSLEELEQTVAIDPEQRTVTASAGMTYGQLCQHLHQEGYALQNMASLPHVTIAGACATATHGSGDDNGNLATSVAALELVTAEGEVVVLSRNEREDVFEGAVVGLGGLGVVTKVTLDVVPAFTMQQEVYESLPLPVLYEHFDEILSSTYSVSLFVDWQQEWVNHVWLKRRLKGPDGLAPVSSFFEARLVQKHLHPLARLSAESCTEQMGIPGPWHERLPHFRMDHTPASGDELQTEYFVPRRHAVAALRAVAELKELLAPVLMISEIRTVAADTLWMSPSYRQATVGIHFSWKKDWPAVEKLLPVIEERLAPFQPRPHWGKLFTMPPSQLQPRYPKLEDFRALLRTYDPEGKFRNAYLDTYIF